MGVSVRNAHRNSGTGTAALSQFKRLASFVAYHCIIASSLCTHLTMFIISIIMFVLIFIKNV